MDEDKRTTIRGWMTKASHDLEMARLALNSDSELADMVCFHCQQAVEKSLKAYLVYRDQDFPKTHHLERLIVLCEGYDATFSDLMDDARELTGYAVESRYPSEWTDVTADEACNAFTIAKRDVAWINEKLKKMDLL